MASANSASDANSGSIVAPTPAPATTEFANIYVNDWKIGDSYEHKVEGKVIPLGRLVKKELKNCGREVVLTFKRANGTKHTHYLDYDHSYRRVINDA